MKNNKQWYKENISSRIKYKEKKEKEERKYEKVNKKTVENRLSLVICLILVLIFLVFLVFFYKPNSIDVLEDIKHTFTSVEIIILGIIISSIIIINLLVKDKKNLSSLLKIVLLFNIVILIVSFYIEINLNNTYNNEEIFSEFYDTKIENKGDGKYIDIWQSLISMDLKTKTEKEVFIDENMSQFVYFRIRIYLIFVLYVIIMMINTYLISKIDKSIKGQEILTKDDKILNKNSSIK